MENEALLTRLCRSFGLPCAHINATVWAPPVLATRLDWQNQSGIDCTAAVFYASPDQRIDPVGSRSGGLVFILL